MICLFPIVLSVEVFGFFDKLTMQIEKFARASPYFVYLSLQMTLENFRKNQKKYIDKICKMTNTFEQATVT